MSEELTLLELEKLFAFASSWKRGNGHIVDLENLVCSKLYHWGYIKIENYDSSKLEVGKSFCVISNTGIGLCDALVDHANNLYDIWKESRYKEIVKTNP